ncbi:MAG: hypothetical protein CM15mP87_01840 [Candidatus Neomarinimicrobiota bacterium]|nr:MAG: hypothetical protein CM15mP87_01840 [Candidatus Neomarinimicrobiota bacterium]
MKWLRNILDKVEPDFKSGGRFESLAPIFEATDTILFSTDERTESGPHIRDSVDIKRVMILVVLSLIPCYVFGAINIGYQKSLTYGLETTWVENLSNRFNDHCSYYCSNIYVRRFLGTTLWCCT